MALHTGLRYPKKLGGIIALSTYLPLADMVANELQAMNKSIPILMIHGLYDNVVLPEWAEISRNTLQKLDYHVDWHTFEMAHSFCQEELSVIVNWLQQVLKS